MKNIKTYIIILLVMILSFVIYSYFTENKQKSIERELLIKENNTIKEDIKKYEEDIKKYEEDIKKYEGENELLTTKIAELNKSKKKLELQLKEIIVSSSPEEATKLLYDNIKKYQ